MRIRNSFIWYNLAMNQFARAHSALFFLILLWGLIFLLMKETVSGVCNTAFPFFPLTISRCCQLNFVTFYPCLSKKELIHNDKVDSSIWLFLKRHLCVFQSIGLERVSSVNSAFLTAFSVVVVSFLELVFLRRKKTQWFDFTAVLLCLVKIFILIDTDVFKSTSGDLWRLTCVFSYTCYIVALQAFSKKLKPADTTLALSYQIAFSLFLSLLTSSYENMGAIFLSFVVIPILFCSIFGTCLVFLQLWHLRYVSLSKTLLIYAFEPVFSKIFGYLFKSKKIYLNNIRGLLILITFLLSELASFKKLQPVAMDN